MSEPFKIYFECYECVLYVKQYITIPLYDSRLYRYTSMSLRNIGISVK